MMTRRSDPSFTPAPLSPFRPWALAIAAAGLVIASLGFGQTAKDQPARGPPRKLVLFDGKSLDGWKKTDFSRAGEVKVEDGTIVMEAGEPMTGITSTRKDLPTTDYELSYEAMRLDGDDFFAAATFPVGKSYITLVNGGWGGNVTGLSSLNGDGRLGERDHAVRQVRGQDLVSVPRPGHRRGDPLLGRRQGDHRRRPPGPAGRHADRDPRRTSRWASPPGRPAAPSARSRSARSRPTRSRPRTRSRNDLRPRS